MNPGPYKRLGFFLRLSQNFQKGWGLRGGATGEAGSSGICSNTLLLECIMYSGGSRSCARFCWDWDSLPCLHSGSGGQCWSQLGLLLGFGAWRRRGERRSWTAGPGAVCATACQARASCPEPALTAVLHQMWSDLCLHSEGQAGRQARLLASVEYHAEAYSALRLAPVDPQAGLAMIRELQGQVAGGLVSHWT